MMLYPALYQINTRVFLREMSQTRGRSLTLADWPGEHLDWIKEQGFDWLWLLGVWQTGQAGRMVSRTQQEWVQGYHHDLPDLEEQDITGSPFAIRAYTVHEDFGGDEALEKLRERLRSRGLQLMLDFVPNHTALDHSWINEHPEYFIHGSEADLARAPRNYVRTPTAAGSLILAHGRDPYFPGWPDTLQLNYRHPALRAAMIGELQRAAERCDGLRCDMTMLLLPEVFTQTWGDASRPIDGSTPVDVSFWPEAVTRVRHFHPSFSFLAEVYWDLEWRMQQEGFTWTYDKRLYDRLHAGAAGPVCDHLTAGLDFQNHLARFLENHDEPRASLLPVALHQAAAMVTFFTPGLRFFHEGQLDGRRTRVSMHLGRRPPEKPDPILQAFYHQVLRCLQRREVREGRWTLLSCRPAWNGNPTWHNFLAWTWEHNEGEPLLVCVNFGAVEGQCYVPLPLPGLAGRKVELCDLMGSVRYERDGEDLLTRGLYLDMPAWDYHLFELQNPSTLQVGL
jgi:glycosidase